MICIEAKVRVDDSKGTLSYNLYEYIPADFYMQLATSVRRSRFSVPQKGVNVS